MRRLSLLLVLTAGCGAAPIGYSAQTVNTAVNVARTTTIVEDLIEEPVRVTGYRIGDKVRLGETPGWVNDDGTVDLARMPEWIAISKAGVVIGYQHNDPKLATLPPEQVDPTSHPELLIYDAAGGVIGMFVDGEPSVENGVQP